MRRSVRRSPNSPEVAELAEQVARFGEDVFELTLVEIGLEAADRGRVGAAEGRRQLVGHDTEMRGEAGGDRARILR